MPKNKLSNTFTIDFPTQKFKLIMWVNDSPYIQENIGQIEYSFPENAFGYIADREEFNFFSPPIESQFSFDTDTLYNIIGKNIIVGDAPILHIIEYNSTKKNQTHKITLNNGEFDFSFRTHKETSSISVAIRFSGKGKIIFNDQCFLKFQKPQTQTPEIFNSKAGKITNALLILKKLGWEKENNKKNSPILWLYSPPAKLNKFQSLLITNGWKFGVAPLPVEEFDELFATKCKSQVITQIHWTAGILKHVTNIKEANQRVKEFGKLLFKIKSSNRKLVWTIHNMLPHNSKFPEQDIHIYELLNEYSDLIHVLNPYTKAEFKDLCNLDEQKTLFIPHPTYHLAQANYLSKHQARLNLNILPNQFTVLLFGSIENYKNIKSHLAVFEKLREILPHLDIQVILAGFPTNKILTQEIYSEWKNASWVRLYMRSINNDEIQNFFIAADMASFYYEKILNSGAAMMAATFNIPFIGPHMGVFKYLKEILGTSTYISGEKESYINEFCNLIENPQKIKSEMEKNIHLFLPEKVSNDFFSMALPRLNCR